MRRWGLRLLVPLLVLLVGFVVVDEVARRTAEHRLAQQLSSRVGATPTVSTHGWPFLAALVTRRLPSLDVALPSGQLAVADRHVNVTDAHLHADGISPVTSPTTATASHVQADAEVAYSTVSRALGLEMTPAGGTRARIREQFSLAGIAMQVDLVGTPSVRDGRLVLDGAQGSVDGQQVSDTEAQAAADQLSTFLTLPSRGGLHVSGIQASDSGVRVTVQGDDVSAQQLR